LTGRVSGVGKVKGILFRGAVLRGLGLPSQLIGEPGP